MSFCNCEDWKQLKEKNATVFQWHSSYGWIIVWKELDDKISHTQVHTYGVSIKYCPMCGKKLIDPAEG